MVPPFRYEVVHDGRLTKRLLLLVAQGIKRRTGNAPGGILNGCDTDGGGGGGGGGGGDGSSCGRRSECSGGQ